MSSLSRNIEFNIYSPLNKKLAIIKTKVISKDLSDAEAELEIITDNKEELPILLVSNEASEGLIHWLKQRVLPISRDGIDDLLEKAGLKEYDVVELLKLNNGRVSDDNYYVKVYENAV